MRKTIHNGGPMQVVTTYWGKTNNVTSIYLVYIFELHAQYPRISKEFFFEKYGIGNSRDICIVASIENGQKTFQKGMSPFLDGTNTNQFDIFRTITDSKSDFAENEPQNII